MKNKLSVVLATKNEEENIGDCLESVKRIADEIIVFDENSSDKTREIAIKHGAKVFAYVHKTNFHETKQKAIEKATGEWVLQLDADERINEKLSDEIRSVLIGRHDAYLNKSLSVKEFESKRKLFLKHQYLVMKENKSPDALKDDISAYFIPRLNYFLGKPLIHAGVYPDGVIRLFKNGKARLPGKSVHELMEVDGMVGWLYGDLIHLESPTFSRYLERANRYTDLTAKEFKIKYKSATSVGNLMYYAFIKPLIVFVKLYFIHKGFLDGMRGFVWSVYSALHFPVAYFKYHQQVKG